jgi:hypothetical protein
VTNNVAGEEGKTHPIRSSSSANPPLPYITGIHEQSPLALSENGEIHNVKMDEENVGGNPPFTHHKSTISHWVPCFQTKPLDGNGYSGLTFDHWPLDCHCLYPHDIPMKLLIYIYIYLFTYLFIYCIYIDI